MKFWSYFTYQELPQKQIFCEKLVFLINQTPRPLFGFTSNENRLTFYPININLKKKILTQSKLGKIRSIHQWKKTKYILNQFE